ncbi:MAG: hypothetical protein ACOC1F_04045 [Myxococcota bacterium]
MEELRERIVGYAAALRADALDWAEGRQALFRLPLLGYLLYAGVRHLLDPMYRSWFAGITLVFHEMGHIVFSLFGRTLMLLGGSIFQLTIPLAAGAYLLLRQRDYFGVTVGGAWLSYAAWELATYVDDANKERLGLVGFSDHPEHDWSALLTDWRLLNHCETIAAFVRVGAFAVWAASMLLGAWLCWVMYRSRRDGASPAGM